MITLKKILYRANRWLNFWSFTLLLYIGNCQWIGLLLDANLFLLTTQKLLLIFVCQVYSGVKAKLDVLLPSLELPWSLSFKDKSSWACNLVLVFNHRQARPLQHQAGLLVDVDRLLLLGGCTFNFHFNHLPKSHKFGLPSCWLLSHQKGLSVYRSSRVCLQSLNYTIWFL